MPEDKARVAPVIERLLEAKLAAALRAGDLTMHRLILALQRRLLSGFGPRPDKTLGAHKSGGLPGAWESPGEARGRRRMGPS